MKTISPRSDMANVNVRSVVFALNADSEVNVPSTRVRASRNGPISPCIRRVGSIPWPVRWNSGSRYLSRSLDKAVLTADWLSPRWRAAALTLPWS